MGMESMLNVSVALICLLAVVFAECLAAIAAPVLQVVGVWIWVDAGSVVKSRALRESIREKKALLGTLRIREDFTVYVKTERAIAKLKKAALPLDIELEKGRFGWFACAAAGHIARLAVFIGTKVYFGSTVVFAFPELTRGQLLARLLPATGWLGSGEMGVAVWMIVCARTLALSGLPRAIGLRKRLQLLIRSAS